MFISFFRKLLLPFSGMALLIGAGSVTHASESAQEKKSVEMNSWIDEIIETTISDVEEPWNIGEDR